MSSLPLNLGVSLLAGILLGSAYFLSLWQTVQRLARRGGAGAWLAVGAVARLTLAAAAFVLATRWGGAPALVAVLTGFVAARAVLSRRLGARSRRTEGLP